MKFKVKFARIVNVAELVEGIIEANDSAEALEKYHNSDYLRFLVVKREAHGVTDVGTPDIEPIK